MTATAVVEPESTGTTAAASPWRAALIRLGAAWAAILLLHARDVGDMVRIWLTSADFGHCLLVPPIVAAIVWGKRAALALVAVAALGWLLGWAGGVAVARHFALVLLLIGVTMSLLGPAVSRALAFPLGYSLFMVPFGDELTGPLQELTARMAMALLDASGIAAVRAGSFITTDDGLFRVAPACAGVNFLLAMVALGVLVAWVGFGGNGQPVRSTPLLASRLRHGPGVGRSGLAKRIAFVAACVVVPVLANGVRAFATIWAAGPLGVDFAASYDHVFYGWFFFALIVALLVGGAWRWFDRPPGDWQRVEWSDLPRISASPVPLLLGLMVLVALPPVWAAAGEGARAALPPQTTLPAAPGWRTVPQAGPRWLPRYGGARTMLVDDAVDTRGRRVSVALVRFDRQVEGAELIGFGQGAANPDLGWLWSASAPAPEGGIGTELRGPQGEQRIAAAWLHMAGTTTGSALTVKALTARARLTGRPTAGAALVVMADPAHGGAAAIADWLTAAGGPDRILAASLEPR